MKHDPDLHPDPSTLPKRILTNHSAPADTAAADFLSRLSRHFGSLSVAPEDLAQVPGAPIPHLHTVLRANRVSHLVWFADRSGLAMQSSPDASPDEDLVSLQATIRPTPLFIRKTIQLEGGATGEVGVDGGTLTANGIRLPQSTFPGTDAGHDAQRIQAQIGQEIAEAATCAQLKIKIG